ncbi:MAG: hydroxyacid dehydrogenase [Bacteroidetes bacterium]|nr:hydroxyacid dehydrogenase [Bacteroidota bacterium]
MSKKVLIAAPVHHVLTDWLNANGYECIVNEKITQAEAHSIVTDCVGIITSTRLLIDKELIDVAPDLKWIGRMGSGMEVIDVPYATAKGIDCYSSPEGNRNAVAEHLLGMLLSLNKRIIKSNNEVKQGDWIRDANRGTELEGKTIGIIGFGNTGRALARKLSVFDMQILAFDKYVSADYPEYVEKCNDLNEIYEKADIVSFHVPLLEDTVNYCNADFINKMRKPFIVINTSRGEIMNISDIQKGLENKKICAACIDVWPQEPLEKMDANTKDILLKIAQKNNVIVTPHIAGYSHEALYKMSKVLLDKIVIKR